ncbi:hypothetical protein BVRB_6g156110 [Beta vulgaris subsp. vulgaris]|uniref:RING-type E3 ubiquitin transferase n=1 Tax=Beta vulgaris subsp. vulgaris TaxID=3555 RepID=A0A0J8BBJ7_BETVV|nr:hypothetical protein BVRB_6g156110 [Beta vulgaris subsp. vulgaris]
MSESSNVSAPLLRSLQSSSDAENSSRMPQTTALALLLGRAAGRRGPSMLVRETAARELEERRADWGYSKPVVALDILWNMAFVVASFVLLICTFHENPNVPIRVWICGYAVQCLVHVLLVWMEYRRRRRRENESVRRGRAAADLEAGEGGEYRGRFDLDGNDSDGDDDGGMLLFGASAQSSFSKRCESVNTMASFLWWIVGFYWVVSGGEQLLQDAPRLYWLTVVYLAFDVFFAIFCVVLACLIGIALCCCLPCIIAILYTVAGQEGASEADLSMLPKYRFQASNDDEKHGVEAGVMVPLETGNGYLPSERVLLPEDAECCICLTSYDDGVELHALPCNHHFHATCIVKWLKMNATCPLCKYNIVK